MALLAAGASCASHKKIVRKHAPELQRGRLNPDVLRACDGTVALPWQARR